MFGRMNLSSTRLNIVVQWVHLFKHGEAQQGARDDTTNRVAGLFEFGPHNGIIEVSGPGLRSVSRGTGLD